MHAVNIKLHVMETCNVTAGAEDKYLTFLVVAYREDIGNVSVALAQSVCVADMSTVKDNSNVIDRTETRLITSKTETTTSNTQHCW